jgi:hypothetical protein
VRRCSSRSSSSSSSGCSCIPRITVLGECLMLGTVCLFSLHLGLHLGLH